LHFAVAAFIMTIADTRLQENITLEKCIIVMGLGPICKTVVLFGDCF